MISRLTVKLQTGDENTRMEAAQDLAVAGKEALPNLIAALKTDKNPAVLGEIVSTISLIDTDALPSLESLLRENLQTGDDLVLRYGANAVAYIAEAGNQDAPVLSEIVPILIKNLERYREADKSAMEAFKPPMSLSPDEIKKTVNPPLEGFDAAAHCLGRIGRQSKQALPLLMEIAGIEANRREGYRKIDGITLILNDLIRTSDSSVNAEINRAFIENRDKLTDKDRRQIERKINVLLAIETDRKQDLKDAFRNFGIYIFPWLALFMIWFTVYIFKPIWLLNLHENLRLDDIRVSSVFGIITIPFAYIFSKVLLRPRTLDAWVTRHLPDAQSNFAKIPTVKDRTIYVTVDLFINEKLEPDFCSEHLQESFNHNQSRILISGVGGAGKTSLACKILQWGMSEQKSERLCPNHSMLPVLLENDFVNTGDDALSSSISSQLSSLLDMQKQISTDLLHTLLRTKRILVLIDGFSEMNIETRNAVLSGISKIPVNAIMLTSRMEEDFNHLLHTSITQTNINGTHLSSFVGKYLNNLNREHLFEDEEFFEGCRILARIVVGERDITALLAKLFVDQMVAKQEKTLDKNLPQNIPSLMLRSIEILYKKSISEDLPLRDVNKAAVIIAWECLKKDFRPLAVAYDDLKEVLSQQSNGEKCLEYLKDKLKLIETTSYDRKLRFKIDPLAEYLGAMHLVKQNQGNLKKWKAFFDRVTAEEQSPQKIKGFLLAVLDCCQVEDEFNIPKSVITRLTGLATVK